MAKARDTVQHVATLHHTSTAAWTGGSVRREGAYEIVVEVVEVHRAHIG
jgi:hypothetical protein